MHRHNFKKPRKKKKNRWTLRSLNFFPVFVLKLNIKLVTGGGNGEYSVTFATMFLEPFSLHLLKKDFKSFHTNEKLKVLATASFYLFFFKLWI